MLTYIKLQLSIILLLSLSIIPMMSQQTSDELNQSLTPHISLNELVKKLQSNDIPAHFILQYSFDDGRVITMEMHQNTQLAHIPTTYEDENGTHSFKDFGSYYYSGRIQGEFGGIACLNYNAHETELFISSTKVGNVFVGKPHFQQKKEVIQNNFQQTQELGLTCENDDHLFYESLAKKSLELRGNGSSSCKKVYLSIFTDHHLYIQKGNSVSRVNDYVKSLLNVVNTIYRQEEIHLGIQEIKVKTTPFGLRHLSATDDLNIFRFVERAYNGDIAICLSGYRDQNGNAPLGGAAITGGLCNQSFSYAYVNVNGGFKNYPDYSWDVFGVAHEVGHVLGSPHTHACVWGPSKNQPIDNCSTPEGGCNPGPKPTKGTIMSYCYKPGQPGVNFALGLGPEPGNLIRDNIANATCLSEFLPNEIMPYKKHTVVANVSCSDGQYTHYYYDNLTTDDSDDILVLSLALNGNDIGNIYDGSLVVKSVYSTGVSQKRATQITASYVEAGKNFHVINKYWDISTTKQPTTPVTVRFPFLQQDLNDLEAAINQRVSIDDIKAFKLDAPANPDPSSNHAKATTKLYHEYTKSTRASLSNWKYAKDGNTHYAEYQVSSFSGGGIGIYEDVALAVELLSFSVGNKGGLPLLYWETGIEDEGEVFDIQKSFNGTEFFSISNRQGDGSHSHYEYLDEDFQGGLVYYRLAMTNISSLSYSSILAFEHSSSSNPNIKTTLINDGQIHIQDIPLQPIKVALVNTSGQIVLTKSDAAPVNALSLDIDHLPQGLYLVILSYGHQEITSKIVVP